MTRPYCEDFRSDPARIPKTIAMASYSYYESDNRVRRYAEALVRRGDRVKVFCIGSDEEVQARAWKKVTGVEVLTLQSRSTPETGKLSYAFRLGHFFIRALFHLGPRHFPDGCDLVHIHNIPDFLIFAGLRLKLKGARLILDIHDIFPELYGSKFSDGRRSRVESLLRFVERQSCAFADHVIVANELWRQTIVERSSVAHKTTAMVNNVDFNLFAKKHRTRDDHSIILLYPGTLNHHQGLDIAIEAVRLLAAEFPKLELHIYGSGQALPDLRRQVVRLGLESHVHFFPGVHLEKVSELMANADIGIVPKRAEGFGGRAYSTKIMEFMSQGLPVVLSRTEIDRYYFDDSVVAFFEPGNVMDLVRVLKKVIEDRHHRDELSRRGFEYALANSWESVEARYLDIVDELTRIPTARFPST